MRLKHTVLVGVLTFVSTMGGLGIGLWAQAREVESPALQWEADRIFVQDLRMRFRKLEFEKLLNFSGAVGVVAIPTLESPVRDMKELESRRVTIGGLYVPTGSLRLNLEPGAYRVELSKQPGSWRARFIDEKGQVRGEAVADVEPADLVRVPTATVGRSVCYRFDHTVVCI